MSFPGSSRPGLGMHAPETFTEWTKRQRQNRASKGLAAFKSPLEHDLVPRPRTKPGQVDPELVSEVAPRPRRVLSSVDRIYPDIAPQATKIPWKRRNRPPVKPDAGAQRIYPDIVQPDRAKEARDWADKAVRTSPAVLPQGRDPNRGLDVAYPMRSQALPKAIDAPDRYETHNQLMSLWDLFRLRTKRRNKRRDVQLDERSERDYEAAEAAKSTPFW